MKFDWDEGKNRANQRKHGITFEEAQTVFFDEHAIEFDDPQESIKETRFLIIGRSIRLRILIISYCFRESIIRIISARKATSKEQTYYISRGKSS
jgi:uncharacterized DUF497 family protein